MYFVNMGMGRVQITVYHVPPVYVSSCKYIENILQMSYLTQLQDCIRTNLYGCQVICE